MKKLFLISLSSLMIFILVGCNIFPTTPTTLIKTSTPSANATTVPTVNATAPAATTSASEPLAKLAEVTTNVFVTDADGKNRHNGVVGETLYLGYQINTDASGRTQVFFADGTTVRVAPNSQLTMSGRTKNAQGQWYTKITVNLGQVWVALNGGSMDVETPVGVGSVRGSYLSISVTGTPPRLIANCLEGDCQISVPGSPTPIIVRAGSSINVQLIVPTAAANATAVPPRIEFVQGNISQQQMDEWIQNFNNPTVLSIARTAIATASLPVTLVPPPSGGQTLPAAPSPSLSNWDANTRTTYGFSMLLFGIVISGTALGVQRWRGRRPRK